VDAAGNVEAARSALLVGDASGPSIAVRVDGSSAGTVLGPSASLNLTAADIDSGVASLEWRWDGGPWSPYGAPIPAGPDGAHVLDVRATDRVGNLAADTFAYDVDATPPAVTLRVFGPTVGTTLGPSASIVLFALDGGSGVASLETRLDGGSWSATMSPLAPGSEGAHVLDYRSADLVGNLMTGSFAYDVDATGPSPSLLVGTPNIPAPTSFVTPATPFSLSAVDPIGVATLSYRIDGGPWVGYAAPFLITAEGLHVIEYEAVDALGNPSAVGSFATTVDGSPPDVRLFVGTPNATVGSTAYVDAGTTFDVQAFDAGAGLASATCTAGGVARSCTTGFTLSGLAGSVVVQIDATDRLGNAATLRRTFFIDPPPLAAIDVLTGTSMAPGQIAVFSGARSNDSAGIVAYAWDFGDGSATSGIVANHSFAAPGEYVVTLTVTNALGRASTTSVLVSVVSPQLPDGGTPGWVIPGFVVLGAVAVLFAAMWWRRRPRSDSQSEDLDEEEKSSNEGEAR